MVFTDLLIAAVACAAGMAVAAVVVRRQVRRLERLLADAARKLERMQGQFARFAPLDVVEQLTEADGAIPAGRRLVTVMFADLRGFTRMCDHLDPEVTVKILNGYFQCMADAIARNHGRVTELVGDGLLALFGALETNPWQARDAVLAALAMRAELARYNAVLAAQALPLLHFGIGIHQGEVLAGMMGTADLGKFAVVGDTINVASRIEQLTKEHQVDLLITDAVRAGIDNQFHLRAMPPMRIKGKPEPIATYHVEGRAG